MSWITGIVLMCLVCVACLAAGATTSDEEAEKFLERAVAIEKKEKHVVVIGNKLNSKEKATDGSESKTNKAKKAKNAKLEEEKQKERSRLVRHRVFQEYCAKAIPSSGDQKMVQGRALDLLTSHIFPACLTYECRWVLELPDTVCDAISEKAKTLRKQAEKYKRHLYIKAQRKRAANVLLMLA